MSFRSSISNYIEFHHVALCCTARLSHHQIFTYFLSLLTFPEDKYADKKKKAEPEPEPAPAADAPQASTQSAAPKAISHEGTKGRKQLIEVNYMQMKTDKLVKETYHYDVTFDPPGPKKFIIQALETFRAKFFKNIVFAFDGRKNVYTSRKLEHDLVEETIPVITEDGREKQYKLKIQFAATVDMTVLQE